MGMQKNPIIVAGGSGYLGKMVINGLSESGYKLVYLNREQINSPSDVINSFGISNCILINLIGDTPSNSVRSKGAFEESNLVTPLKLINTLKPKLKFVIHISSSMLFNCYQDNLQSTKDSQVLLYRELKRTMETELLKLCKGGDLNVKILRIPSIWGKSSIKPDSLLCDLVNSRPIKNANLLSIAEFSTDYYLVKKVKHLIDLNEASNITKLDKTINISPLSLYGSFKDSESLRNPLLKELYEIYSHHKLQKNYPQ
jgi:hypothetical protein